GSRISALGKLEAVAKFPGDRKSAGGITDRNPTRSPGTQCSKSPRPRRFRIRSDRDWGGAVRICWRESYQQKSRRDDACSYFAAASVRKNLRTCDLCKN